MGVLHTCVPMIRVHIRFKRRFLSILYLFPHFPFAHGIRCLNSYSFILWPFVFKLLHSFRCRRCCWIWQLFMFSAWNIGFFSSDIRMHDGSTHSTPFILHDDEINFLRSVQKKKQQQHQIVCFFKTFVLKYIKFGCRISNAEQKRWQLHELRHSMCLTIMCGVCWYYHSFWQIKYNHQVML